MAQGAGRADAGRTGDLGTYRAKRRPGRTPEPGTGGRPEATEATEATDHTGDDQDGRGDTFVVQEHHARALHWDVRLERDGVGVSWAVPKGLPTDPATNHLAKHVEDHPLDYGGFEGEIPRGEYGGGTVTIWDRGTYDLEKWTDAEVKVVLHGGRVQGRYVFFRTGGTGSADWMVHRMDPPTDPAHEPPPTRVTPMLAVQGPLPTGDQWAFEVKWDGVRVIATVDGGRVRARGRSGRDVTATYPELRALGRALGSTQAVLDGEIVAFGADGRPDFALLAHRMHVSDPAVARRLAQTAPVRYMVFDLLYLDGRPTIELSYDDRRALLEALPGPAVPESFHGDGEAVLAASLDAGLEGVVAKRRGSTYQPGRRSHDWVKVKNVRRQTVVIGGWEPGEGRRADRIGALLVGVAAPAGSPSEAGGEIGGASRPRSVTSEPGRQAARFVYAGQVGTGFSEATLDDLAALLRPLHRDAPPFPDVPPEYARDARWVSPELVAEVEYSSWTADGRLRHPSFKGLRDDVHPSEVTRELG